MKIRRNKKGFTLIELIVVIAILGILAAILVPVISGFIRDANQRTDVANAKLLYNAGMALIANGITGTYDGNDFADMTDYVGNTWPLPRASYTNTNGFAVDVDASAGTCVVTVGGQWFHPDTGTITAVS